MLYEGARVVHTAPSHSWNGFIYDGRLVHELLQRSWICLLTENEPDVVILIFKLMIGDSP